MDDDRDLRKFSGRCRLFPLPRVVMFPHSILPLHIFEPRYRQMTEDALADDQLVTMVQLRTTPPGTPGGMGSPPIEVVGCLGRILQHEKLPDGRFNILLLGRRRVLLHRELSTDRLYRVAEAEILEDVDPAEPVETQRSKLIGLFRKAFERRHQLDADLANLLENDLPVGVLTDIVGHALGLPLELKQQLLAEPMVGQRAERLISVLSEMLGESDDTDGASRGFPPPFSLN